MEHFYDEFSKSLAASVPRRESLRRMGAVFAGAVLGQLGLGSAWAAGQDPCKAFCNRCSNKTQKNQCLAACQACNGNTGRLCGSCGAYACCSTSETCCSGYCADLDNDFGQCGGCGTPCDDPAPYEYGVCVGGECVYWCVDGAQVCDGTCTPVSFDPDNCGTCGNACGGSTPDCIDGVCGACEQGLTSCSGGCTNLMRDSLNCGGCGNVCPDGTACSFGACQGVGGGDSGYVIDFPSK